MAVARSLMAAGGPAPERGPWEVVFAVAKGDMGRTLLEREGFKVLELSGQGLPRRPSLKLLTFPIKLLAGFRQARSMLEVIKPAMVIGMGGYLSFSVLLAARLQDIPILIHEQNVLPGLANRILAHVAGSIAVSFSESQRYFPRGKVWLSGLPVRSEIGQMTPVQGRARWGLDPNRFTLLVFGGSLGAHALNQAVVDAIPLLVQGAPAFQVIHVTGPAEHEIVQNRYQALPVKAVVMHYCHDMAAAYAAADLVICRAGASTVAELMVVQKPAILIPYPYASGNHQFYNAEILVKRGLAEMILDRDLNPAVLARYVRAYLDTPEKINSMQQRFMTAPEVPPHRLAAQRLARYIRKTL
jgi:UDP-N-acetylglucosamine--N-acetylmuramyl-(pentapeptide) pyrophosphoryl-undecaprenol N-acetylglucosamine transferase